MILPVWLQQLFGLLADITPELVKLIDTCIPSLEQEEMTNRIRRAKRKLENLLKANGELTADDFMDIVDIDFEDKTQAMQTTIENWLQDEMKRDEENEAKKLVVSK